MNFSDNDWLAISLTIKLALTVTILLMVLAMPLAWWLARTRHWSRGPVSAFVALPLVLPPTVIGFYFLLALGANGPIGKLTQALSWDTLAFSFEGLVIASLFYSLPFVVQPLMNAFSALPQRQLEVAATLGASPLDRFFTIVLPQSKYGLVTAAILCFAHTVGEFGVVLMIGGNIPGETKVVSVQIYEHVEALDMGQAHALSLAMLLFSFLVLTLVYSVNRKQQQGRLL